MNPKHIDFMNLALSEARKAGQKNEIPIGAVLIAANDELLSAAHNKTIILKDPTAHAEILALRSAAEKIGNYRLLKTTLYVTVEPCPMCMGALCMQEFRGLYSVRAIRNGERRVRCIILLKIIDSITSRKLLKAFAKVNAKNSCRIFSVKSEDRCCFQVVQKV